MCRIESSGLVVFSLLWCGCSATRARIACFFTATSFLQSVQTWKRFRKDSFPGLFDPDIALPPPVADKLSLGATSLLGESTDGILVVAEPWISSKGLSKSRTFDAAVLAAGNVREWK